MGTALRELVRYDEAAQAVEASLRIMRADPAASMIWRGHAAHQMSLILASKGDLDGAKSVANALLEEQRRYLGNKHPTTLATLLAVSRVLMKTGQYDSALPLMQEYLRSAAELYPLGNTTIAYQRWLAALLLLWKGDKVEADRMFRESVAQHARLVGYIDESTRLRWRDWVLALSSLADAWQSKALRDQVWCAMEDLVRDHAPMDLAREAFDVDGLKFKLARWQGNAPMGEWQQGSLADLKKLPKLESGLHLLGLELPRPTGVPVRRAFWLLMTPWQVSTFAVPRTHEAPRYWKQHVEGPPISSKTHHGLAFSSTLGCIAHEIERIDFFGMVATSEVDLPAGQYRVAMSVDDGVRLYIDDRLVMDDWGGHATRTHDVMVELTEGKHRLRVEFYQAASGHQLWLQFAPMNREAKLAAAALGGSMPRADSRIFQEEVKLAEGSPDTGRAASYAHQLAWRGRFEESCVAYQTALGKGSNEHACWFMYAHVLAHLGKAREYAEHCSVMLDRFGMTKDVVTAEATARACLLLPGHVDPRRLEPLLKLSAETKATRPHWVCLTAGLAAYRVGEFEKALALFEEARPIFRVKEYSADAATEALIALCLKRLGRDALAAQSAQQARAWFEEKAPVLGVDSLNHRGGAENWLLCQIVFREGQTEFPTFFKRPDGGQ